MGSNGAGKTTLAKAIVGLEESENIFFDNKAVAKMSANKSHTSELCTIKIEFMMSISMWKSFWSLVFLRVEKREIERYLDIFGLSISK